MTLVELIVAMVIIGVCLASLLSVFSRTSRASTDPMVIKQMTAIAEGMMEEIQRMPFAAASNNGLPSNACARDNYNNLEDYNQYQNKPCDVMGTAIPGLDAYQVNVAVVKVVAGPMLLATAGDSFEITIKVSRGTDSFTLRGWRTNFGKFQP
ncbi:MSHA pilin protein MshD [Massilia violacea]|uniref:MSHA pilin protein MshD n=2 Tax=Pseudoduganella violacea TaxID=1715466 RepID=A0A7W5BDQ0_9BURK|nr:type II secretion system protein [Pseudoduganella violacea]MBB3121239.1 MSHA pilin protein MshD [Pseudoduganella violacea]